MNSNLSKEPLDFYISNEINVKSNEILILCKEKRNNEMLDIYSDVNPFTNERISKTYTLENYNYIKKNIEKDTVTKYWTEKDKISSYFKAIIPFKKINSYRLENIGSKIIYNVISDPFYIEDKKIVIFYHRSSSSDNVIVMKKTNEEWEIIEKIPSQKLH
ncbi:MAG: hypothetical protein HC854_04525 [Flavobacterium sp.]|nr:hypothetical protein [Flavobacterium sp.]